MLWELTFFEGVGYIEAETLYQAITQIPQEKWGQVHDDLRQVRPWVGRINEEAKHGTFHKYEWVPF